MNRRRHEQTRNHDDSAKRRDRQAEQLCCAPLDGVLLLNLDQQHPTPLVDEVIDHTGIHVDHGEGQIRRATFDLSEWVTETTALALVYTPMAAEVVVFSC